MIQDNIKEQPVGVSLVCSTVIALIVLMLSTSSCDQGVIVDEDYPFTVEIMPYYEETETGQVVEVRCQIDSEKRNSDLHYSLRYFPKKGKGLFTIGSPLGDGLIPNDRYVLPLDEEGAFRLYYRPESMGSHTLLLTVESSMGRKYPMELKFNVNKTK